MHPTCFNNTNTASTFTRVGNSVISRQSHTNMDKRRRRVSRSVEDGKDPLEGIGHNVGQSAEEGGAVEEGGERSGAIGLCNVASAAYIGEGAWLERLQHAEGTGTFLVPPVSRSHAATGATPRAPSQRVWGPTKD